MLATLVVIGSVLGPRNYSGCSPLIKIACTFEPPEPPHPLASLAIFGAGTIVTVLLLRAGDRRRSSR
jgi:hypothetical protein